MKDIALELAIAKQRNPSHPLYLSRKFDDWTEKTGLMNGWGLTWMLRLPIGIILLIMSPLYWLIIKRGQANEKTR